MAGEPPCPSCLVWALGVGLLLLSASMIVLKNALFTALGSIVLVFIILSLFNVIINKAVYAADGVTVVKPQLKLRWDILLKFMFATMDLATDVLFMQEMYLEPITSDIFWVSAGFFIFSDFLNYESGTYFRTQSATGPLGGHAVRVLLRW